MNVGSIFEDSPLGLDKWLPCIWLISNCKNGVSSFPRAASQNSTGTYRRTSKSVARSTALKSYDGLTADFEHAVVDHAVEYVRGNVHTNTMEDFWSLLKRQLHGTYISVEPYHLFRYLDEQSFRYNGRRLTDAERFHFVCGQIAGRRLTWKRLTGKEANEETCIGKGVEASGAGQALLTFDLCCFLARRLRSLDLRSQNACKSSKFSNSEPFGSGIAICVRGRILPPCSHD